MSALRIEKTNGNWLVVCGSVALEISSKTGCVCRSTVYPEGQGDGVVWSEYVGDVVVTDGLLGRDFGTAQLSDVDYELREDILIIRKTFKDAPWSLTERYSEDEGALSWDARVEMATGAYRSCRISWCLPWPREPFSVKLWAARHSMPSDLCMYAGTQLEYGEVTSGILMPSLICYRGKPDGGLLLTLPFDWKTPHFSFGVGLRELNLRVQYDWLALSPSHAAEAKLLLCGTVGDWRPGLGWLYERYQEYFEAESELMPSLWGGHISGSCNPNDAEVSAMARLGMKWYELHEHFYAYGNYHPEHVDSWKSGHRNGILGFDKSPKMISEGMIHDSIRRLHEKNIAVMPYIQVNGDGDETLLSPVMESSRIKTLRGETFSAYPGTLTLNSDLDLPFGKDITRQIDGMAKRYPEMDGVFVDQACYNFIDTAHDDGMTAIDNRPAYMTGYCYDAHLEHLAQILHPKRAIIANGPYCIRIMRHIDGLMAEGSGWLCDHYQYYSIGSKPMFFLLYEVDDANIEVMFQRALIYGAGFASFPRAMPSAELYDLYMPVLEKLYRRRWVFERNPLELPSSFAGNIFRSERGTLLVSCVRTMSRYQRADARDGAVVVSVSGVSETTRCTAYQPGKAPAEIPFTVLPTGKLSITLPHDFNSGVIEIQ